MKTKPGTQAYLIPITLIAAAMIFGGSIFYSANQEQKAGEGQPTPTVTATITPTNVMVSATATATPSATPSISDADLLRTAVRIKSGIPANKFEFSLGTNSGTMARGSIRHTDDISGAAWFAGKLNGVWKVSYIGQGVPLCSEIADFNYPTSWLSHCMGANGQTVER